MKSQTKTLQISCLAVLIGSCLMVGHCSKRLRKTSPMFNFIFPPADFYHPLAQLPFSSSLEGKLYECSFTTRYPGFHSVEVIATEPVEVVESYGTKLTIEITIKDEAGAVLVEEILTPSYSSFWGINESGIKLFSFKTPDDVPLGKPLIAHIKVKTADGAFENECGPLTLRIIKMSDE